MTGFGNRAWAATAELRAAIEELPFLSDLAGGTLDQAVVRHYLEQDALYLAGYARALALLAARAPDAAATSFWAAAANECGEVEVQLHADLLAGQLGEAGPGATEPSPTCLAYVSYLVATAATAPYAVGAAAVLPCFWVYADVGRRLARTAASVPGHPYRQWIDAYDAEPFQESTARARSLVDDAARQAPQETAAMHRAFATALRYELQFWIAAAEREAWSHPL